jgi:hypothetical protein
MERLTEYISEIPCVAGCGKNCKYEYRYCDNMGNCPTLNNIIDKLAKYEDMEERQLLLITSDNKKGIIPIIPTTYQMM